MARARLRRIANASWQSTAPSGSDQKMVLPHNPDSLLEMIQAAEEVRDDHLANLDSMIERLHGPYWRDEDGDGGYAPENMYFQYMSLMVPRLVFDNPASRVKSRRQGPQAEVAVAIEAGLNRWVRDVGIRKHLEQVAVDNLLAFGVMMVTEERRPGVSYPGIQKTPRWPTVKRISPRRYFQDHEAMTMDELRFCGHEWTIDKDDLLKRAKDNKKEKWNIELIESMAEDSKHDSRDSIEGTNRHPARHQVRAYEVYLPEVRLDKSPGRGAGFSGTLFTLGVDQPSDGTEDDEGTVGFLRDPRPYYGPPTGPYHMFGSYSVPDSAYPLAALAATDGQIQDLNEHVGAAAMSMKAHKRLIAVRDHKTATQVNNLDHDHVFVADFDHNGKALIEQVEIGGHTQHMNDWIQQARERTDRALGMDDALRGNVTGEGTATEHTIASEASSTRIAFLKQKFTDATAGVLEHAAWYMYHSSSIVFPLGSDGMNDAPDMGERWFVGGDPDPGSGYSFYDLELEIEPYSMERTNEGLNQKRAMESHQLLLNTMPLMQQFPDYPWRRHFEKIGASLNIPNLHELVTDEFLGRLGADLQMQRMLALQTDAKPRTGMHLGPPGAKGMPPIKTMATATMMPGQQMGAQLGGDLGGEMGGMMGGAMGPGA